MKAAVIHQFGDFDVLKYEDIATPKPRSGNVLVKILAAGVNRLDHYLREGSVVPDFPFPHILGADAAGEVFRPGKGVTDFEIGERVIVVQATHKTRKTTTSIRRVRRRVLVCPVCTSRERTRNISKFPRVSC